MNKNISLPLSNETILGLHVGDAVLISGVMVTGRDAVHKWLLEAGVEKTRGASKEDAATLKFIQPLLNGGVIYHCGPVVSGLDTKQYRFVAAGPTTSIREEPYQGRIMHHFNLKGIIGKGGMGAETLKACQEVPGVYFHAIGGAASLIAETVQKVLGVHKLDFGVPEAIWVIEVKDFPAVVTMDAHGRSLHFDVRKSSQDVLERLIA